MAGLCSLDTKLCKASQRDCRPKNFLGRNATRGCPPGTPRSSALGLVVCTNSPIRAARADDAAKLSDFFLFVFRDWGLESCAKRLRCLIVRQNLFTPYFVWVPTPLTKLVRHQDRRYPVQELFRISARLA